MLQERACNSRGFIPGPNIPKHVKLVLFPSFHHIAALQKEGLRVCGMHLTTLYLSHITSSIWVQLMVLGVFTLLAWWVTMVPFIVVYFVVSRDTTNQVSLITTLHL